MTCRVVVYAEGRADDVGPHGSTAAPREDLDENELGAAHLLVRRAIARESRIPEPAIRFVAPLRLDSGRRHAGSDLLEKKKLRRLLTWPTMAPDFAVVLVDEDGDGSRQRCLLEAIAGIPLAHVIAVPVREFETWLIGDPKAVREVTGHTGDLHPQPDVLAPRRAKELLDDWLGRGGSDRRSMRLRLARECSLDALVRLEAFQQFTGDLRRVLTASAR